MESHAAMAEEIRKLRESNKELAGALARYAPARCPSNIMGGCCECGSEVAGEHKRNCHWQATRATLAKAGAALK